MIPSWLGRLTDSIRHVSPSDVAAWWGAIAATMVLIWNLLRAVRLKGRLKVEAIYRGDSRQPHLPPVLAVRVTNVRSEEHTSELQSRVDLVCRLLLEKKKQNKSPPRLSPSP